MKPVYIMINEVGDKYYFSDKAMTVLHREDGPAIEYANGDKFWYLDGKLHREGGPAIEYVNGDKEWYIYGRRHREDGPAIEHENDFKAWYVNGKCHRVNGPAFEFTNGEKRWYLDDVEIYEEEFNRRTKSSCEGKIIGVDGKKYKLTAI